jgi:hypothetical protein
MYAVSEQAGRRHVTRRGLTLAGRRLFVPAAAQCPVKIDLAVKLREAIGNERLLRTEQLTLSVEEGQVAVDADTVATLGQTVVVLVGVDEVSLRLKLIGVGLACGQTVGDFLKRCLNRLLVVGDADVFLDLRVIKACAQTARVEDRQIDRLAVPALAVRLMLGKNAARAAPMLALAAFRLYSA